MQTPFRLLLTWTFSLFLLLPTSVVAAGRPPPIATDPPPSPGPLAPTLGQAQAGSAVRILLQAVNRDRALHKVPALILDVSQSLCSTQHSKHMANTGRISHDEFPGDVCVPHVLAGENVGVTWGNVANAVVSLHDLMMSEGPCHRKTCSVTGYQRHGHYLNLVNPEYRHIGIGVYLRNGVTWLTEDFTA